MDTAKVITVGKKYHRPLFDDHLTQEDIEKARIELNETESSRITALQEVKQKLSGDISSTYGFDDEFIVICLRTKKFNCDKTVKLLKNYRKIRQDIPGFFPNPSSIEKALRSNIINFLPHRDHKGRAIHVCKAGLWNPDEISFNVLVGISVCMFQLLILNPVTQINGFIGIWDASGMSIKQFIQLSYPKHILAFVKMIQDHAPGRFKALYLINVHKIGRAVFNLVRHFLTEKLRKRVTFLGSDLTELHAYVDPAILPVEFGGVQPTRDSNEITDKVLEKEHYTLEKMRYTQKTQMDNY